MPSNRRRHINALPGLKLLVAFFVVVLLLLTGLGYVYNQNRLHHMSDEIGRLEKERTKLRMAAEGVEVNIAKLSSPQELKKKLDNGFFKLADITADHVIRISVPAKNPAGEGRELRAVSNGKGHP